MALLGSIQDFNLFSIFNMIKSQNKIGTLAIQHEESTITITIDNGSVVGIESNKHDMEDGLILNLMRLGLISQDGMKILVDLHGKTLKSIKTIALETNMATQQNIQDASTMQAMSIVCPLFGLTSGNYRFDSATETEAEKINLPPVSVQTILIEAAKYVDEWPHIVEQLPSFSQFLVKAAMPEPAVDADSDGPHSAQPSGTKLTYEEEVIIGYFERPNSIGEVVSTSRYPELDTCKHIVNLFKNNLLRLYEQNLVPTPSMMLQISDIKKKQMKMFSQSSILFWPSVAVFILVPIFTYMPSILENIDQGLASMFSRRDAVQNRQTEERAALVALLVNAQSDGRSLAIKEGLSQNDLINTQIRQLFDRYQSDPLTPIQTSRPRTN